MTTARTYPPVEGFSRHFRRFRPLGALNGFGPLQWFATSLVTGAIVLATILVAAGVAREAPVWLLCALAAGAFLAERQSVQLTSNAQASISALPIVFAAVVFSPLDAMIVGACALLGDFGRPHTRWVVWTSSRSLAGGVAGTAALAVTPDPASLRAVCLTVAVAVCVDAVVDSGFAIITAGLRRNGSVDQAIAVIPRLFGATLPLQAVVVGVLAYTYLAYSPWTLLLFLIPAIACQRLLVLYQGQRHLAEELRAANARLERANLSFASGLVAALDARDRYTAGHSAAVAVYSRDIAAELGLSVEDQQQAHLCGLLHDIGKVGVSPSVLEKAGPLTVDERAEVEKHSEVGERILLNVDEYDEIAHVVRHHHERWDGEGYPDRLAGSNIPLIARIIGVADAYNAMTSARPYRDALPTSVARARLRDGSGSQFDPEVVDAFDEILANANAFYVRGAGSTFAVEANKHSQLGSTSAVAAAR